MKRDAAVNDSCLLVEVGVTEQEERAYRFLLAQGSATEHDLCRALLLSTMNAQQLLSSLETKGLATRLPERVPRYLPTNPELAIEALILRKQTILERTRRAISLFDRINRETMHSIEPHGGEQRTVEVVTGRVAILQAYQQLQRATRHELRCLVPRSLTPTVLDPILEETRARGVRYLNVLDAQVMTDPDFMSLVRAQAPGGREFRISQHVPFNLLIADGRIALLPVDVQKPDGVSLLVRSSSLLDGLTALFEMIWERTTPLELARPGTAEIAQPASPFPSEVAALIPFLAAGFNDKAVAHELNISVRTLIRRIASLLGMLGARSRFQAGWLAALHLHGQSRNERTTLRYVAEQYTHDCSLHRGRHDPVRRQDVGTDSTVTGL